MPDIVIGARRPTHQRPLRSAAIAAALLFVCALVAYIIYLRIVSYVVPETPIPNRGIAAPSTENDVARPAASPGLAFGKSSLTYSGSIAIVRTSGSVKEVGAAHGRLVGSELLPPLAAVDANIDNAVPTDGWLSSLTHGIRSRWSYRLLDDGIPGHQLVEIASVLAGLERSTGSSPSYERFVQSQAVLDVGVSAPWSSGAGFRAMARSLSVLSTLRGPGGDRLLVGRSVALPGAGDGGDAAAASLTVSFVRANDVIPFASVGWPGLVGVISGVNAEGIAVMVHPTRTSDVILGRNAQPVALLARDILENARTLQEATKVLEKSQPLGAASFVVVDGNARAWVVIERSPEGFAITRAGGCNGKPCAVTDVLSSEAFADDPDNDRARRVRPSLMRAKRASALVRRRAEEPGDLAAVLRDRQSPEGAPLPLGHRGALYDPSAVHAAIFDVSGMVLWVADRADAEAKFRAFDLRYELRGEGARPAAPADLPAAESRDDTSSWRSRQARRHLRAARRMWRDGAESHAREEIERALAHVPKMPEALQLAGDLARATGDRDRAQRLYQLYIDAGPDDLGAEQEIRAVLEN